MIDRGLESALHALPTEYPLVTVQSHWTVDGIGELSGGTVHFAIVHKA